MSIISVGPWPGTRGSSRNNQWQRTYERSLKVCVSSPGVGSRAVLAAVDPTTGERVPDIGNTYDADGETDTASWVQSVKCTESGESGLIWKVDVTYGPYDPQQFGQDPMLWPIRVSFQGRDFERVVWFDVTGAPILNSAHVRFADPITVPDSDLQIVIRRNELVKYFDALHVFAYNNKVSANDWNNIPGHMVRVGPITAGDPQTAPDGSVYHEVIYTVAINPRGWQKELLDQGLTELDNSSPPRQRPILDADGQPVNDPAPLNGSGKRLPTNGTPVKLTFDVETRADLAPLNLNLALRYGA